MKQTQKKTFLKQGTKEVVHFITVPQLNQSLEHAELVHNEAVQTYINGCSQGFNIYYAKDNSFSTIIIHGMND